MSAAADAVLAQFHALPEEDRVQVAQQINGIFDPPCSELDDELRKTLDRRWEEIVSGKVKCRDAFEVLNDIEARLHERFATAS